MSGRWKRVFDLSERSAFWVGTWVAFLVYFFSLGPSVGLEDAGELATAADGLGVPHPPGYPLWTILSWFFCRLFAWVTWQGYPNPAWAIALSSAVLGALATGVTAWLIVRSGRDLLERTTSLDAVQCRRVAWWSGVSASLAFALSPVMWSQSVIVEVYALGALFMALTLLLTYQWLCRSRRRTLVWLGLVFGLGLTNYQVLLLAVLPIGMVVAVRRWQLAKSFLAVLVPLGLVLLVPMYSEMRLPLLLAGTFLALGMVGWLCLAFRRSRRFAMVVAVGQLVLLLLGVTVFASTPWHPLQVWFWVSLLWGVGLVVLGRFWLVQGRTVAWTLGAVALGLSVYLYLPLVSEFLQPAMNWGCPRTWEGFCRVLSRGQYEAIVPVSEGVTFLRQVMGYVTDLRAQFSPWVIVGAVFGTGVLAWGTVRARTRVGWLWLGCTGLCFAVMSVVLIALANPTGDLQDTFIQKVKFISSHGIFALWIGYGLMGAFVVARRWGVCERHLMVLLRCVAVFIPLMPVWANIANRELIRTFGATEQTGHDYGWQFGAYMLNGAPTIRAELSRDEEPLPDPFYPPPMDEGAVFFGGTDPGRFIPTYLVHAADFRKDIIVFTQNALADRTYMDAERDLYGHRMLFPEDETVRTATLAYAEEVLSGKRPNSGAVTVDVQGRVAITGQTSIMEINAWLAEQMFAQNPERTFYIEESYPMRWMKPYLEPAGLALRLNRQGGKVSELKARDGDFWDWMTRRLVAEPGYRRDVAAQKSFSQLRLAYGRLYGLNRSREEEGRAYQDALALYPLSFATTLKYAQWLTVKPTAERVDSAARMVRRFRAIDPANVPAREVEAQLQPKVAAWAVIHDLVQKPEGYKPSSHEYVRLAQAQATLGAEEDAARLWGFLAAQSDLTDEDAWLGCQALLQMGHAPTTAYKLFCRVSENFMRAQTALDLVRCAWMCQEVQDVKRARICLQLATEQAPTSPEVWAEVMVFAASVQSREKAIEACRKVLQYGTEEMLNARPEYRAAVQWMNAKDGGTP